MGASGPLRCRYPCPFSHSCARGYSFIGAGGDVGAIPVSYLNLLVGWLHALLAGSIASTEGRNTIGES